MGWLWTGLCHLLFVVASPFLLLHPKLRHGFKERLGWHQAGFPGLPALDQAPRIWLHGASAGDVLALTPTARALKARHPALQLIASTITNSGRVITDRHGELFDAVTYQPYDLSGPVRRTLERLRPGVLVLEYTELWPQLINTAHRRGVRLVLHNGRLSRGQLQRYRWLFAFTGNLLTCFDLLLMRDNHEAERALALGAPADRVIVAGNTKFDNLTAEPPKEKVAELRRAAGLPPDCRVWVAGSTHEGEEERLLDVFVSLRQDVPDLHMIIAPRYVERAERIAAMAEKRGLPARLRSRPGDCRPVLVLDTIGELAACYALASLVFVGGSFVRRGGQNILEPAACAKPVLFGPHVDNVADSVQVLLGRGGIQVQSPEQLRRLMAELLANETQRRELGALAHRQVLAIRGAAERNAAHIAGLL